MNDNWLHRKLNAHAPPTASLISSAQAFQPTIMHVISAADDMQYTSVYQASPTMLCILLVIMNGNGRDIDYVCTYTKSLNWEIEFARGPWRTADTACQEVPLEALGLDESVLGSNKQPVEPLSSLLTASLGYSTL